ncbi:MAG: hypothetical protein Hyperionvirus8_38 [Hyperionvirus sp.]|uniref:Uncharacterized protein n=1 Tax=Hyperionvirus sp. TaxID=2487770 RepID=A0A3G5AAJ1_9VIRU|nr:MAG: hypothetical protein Hyperionvirus8_38 [Hyperionvirus sp.]
MNNILLGDHVCTVDKCGNIYFALKSDPSKLYDITVTKDNLIVCDRYVEEQKGDAEPDTEEIIVGELKPFDEDEKTLRQKIIKQKREEDETADDSDKDDETNEDIQKKYFPEDLEYNEYIDIRKTKEPYFVFSMVDDLSEMIVNRESVPALYETIIYEGDFEKNSPILKTTLINDLPLYRLCIYTSGDIKFRAIGSRDNIYKLDQMELKPIQLLHKCQ